MVTLHRGNIVLNRKIRRFGSLVDIMASPALACVWECVVIPERVEDGLRLAANDSHFTFSPISSAG